jgi:hypothetical protein
MPLFVWVKGLQGPEPQVFNDTVMGEASVKEKKVLFRQEISTKAALLGLHGLALQFPCPVQEETDDQG